VKCDKSPRRAKRKREKQREKQHEKQREKQLPLTLPNSLLVAWMTAMHSPLESHTLIASIVCISKSGSPGNDSKLASFRFATLPVAATSPMVPSCSEADEASALGIAQEKVEFLLLVVEISLDIIDFCFAAW
jgi:hypothetical protein